MLALAVLAAILAGANYYFNPVPATAPASPAYEAESRLTPVGVEEAAEMHRAGAIFVDARDGQAFRAGHVPRARPLREVLHSGGGPTKDRPLVVYGQGSDLEPVLAAAEKFRQAGAGRVYVFIEGLEGWLMAGGRVEKGMAE